MEIKTYQPGYAEAIAGLWNRRIKGCFATGPLTTDIFLSDVAGKKYFDPAGLVLVFNQGRLVAFVHAGFKSSNWIEPDLRLGTIAMIGVEDGHVADGMAAMAEAIEYLRRRGTKQVEAFAIDFAKMPFYNGLYGGEAAGMDESHPCGMELMSSCHFNISNGAVIMEHALDDVVNLPPAPQGLQIRIGPWESPLKNKDAADCYGIPETIRRASLLDANGVEKAGITFWHLERYNRLANDHMAVVSHVGTSEALRGTGAAVYLQLEVHRILRNEGIRRIGLGTGGGNGRAVNFYRKLGYQPVKTAYSFFYDWRYYERGIA